MPIPVYFSFNSFKLYSVPQVYRPHIEVLGKNSAWCFQYPLFRHRVWGCNTFMEFVIYFFTPQNTLARIPPCMATIDFQYPSFHCIIWAPASSGTLSQSCVNCTKIDLRQFKAVLLLVLIFLFSFQYFRLETRTRASRMSCVSCEFASSA